MTTPMRKARWYNESAARQIDAIQRTFREVHFDPDDDLDDIDEPSAEALRRRMGLGIPGTTVEARRVK